MYGLMEDESSTSHDPALVMHESTWSPSAVPESWRILPGSADEQGIVRVLVQQVLRDQLMGA